MDFIIFLLCISINFHQNTLYDNLTNNYKGNTLSIIPYILQFIIFFHITSSMSGIQPQNLFFIINEFYLSKIISKYYFQQTKYIKSC